MKILFQGDSITDAGRSTEQGSMVSIGQGYAVMAAGELGAKYPGKITFENRGICGNRSVDLYARAKADIWNLKPDFMSLLIGVNDVWGELQFGDGVDAARFERVYRMLLEDTFHYLPDIKILLLEPYALREYGTEPYWDRFHEGVTERAEIVRSLADEYHLPCISLQRIFEEACEHAPTAWWLPDGVHPSPAGHRLIADAWLDMFYRNFSELL